MLPEDANRKKLTFTKKERICSKIAFQQLIRENRNLFRFPLKCYYTVHPYNGQRSHSAIAIAVSKKSHKRAVDRNRIKRQIREAWRLNHHDLLDNGEYFFDILFIYVAKERLFYSAIEKTMQFLLRELNHKTFCHEMD